MKILSKQTHRLAIVLLLLGLVLGGLGWLWLRAGAEAQPSSDSMLEKLEIQFEPLTSVGGAPPEGRRILAYEASVAISVIDGFTRQPIGSATLYAVAEEKAYYVDGESRILGRTDARGQISIPRYDVAGSQGVLVIQAGYRPHFEMLPREAPYVQVVLRRASKIDGVIKTSAGDPIKGARVWVSRACVETRIPPEGSQGTMTGAGDDATWAAVSDESGRFRVDGVPMEAVRWRAVHDQFVVLEAEPAAWTCRNGDIEVSITMDYVVGAWFAVGSDVHRYRCHIPEGLQTPSLSFEALREMAKRLSLTAGDLETRCILYVQRYHRIKGWLPMPPRLQLRVLTEEHGWRDISVSLRRVSDLQQPEQIDLGPAPSRRPTARVALSVPGIPPDCVEGEQFLLIPSQSQGVADGYNLAMGQQVVSLGESGVVAVGQYRVDSTNEIVRRQLENQPLTVTIDEATTSVAVPIRDICPLVLYMEDAKDPRRSISGLLSLTSNGTMVTRSFCRKVLVLVSPGCVTLNVSAFGYDTVLQEHTVNLHDPSTHQKVLYMSEHKQ